MTPGTRDYWCPVHGRFEAYVAGTDPEAVWEQPCPRCGRAGELTRPLPPAGGRPAPAVHGDVRAPYYSPWVDRWIGSKADLRRAHAELGVVPLSDADLKAAAEASEAVMNEKRAERQWLERGGGGGDPDDAPLPVEVDRTDPVDAGLVPIE